MTSTGHRTARHAAAAASGSPAIPRAEAYSSSMVSGPTSIAQATQSSRCLVECGSGNISAKKNSAKSRQSALQWWRFCFCQPS